MLHRLDESMTACHRHWEEECAGMAGWAEKTLEQAAANLARQSARGSTPVDVVTNLAPEAVTSAILSHYLPFLQEYEDLAKRIRAGIDELNSRNPEAGMVMQELPKLSCLPAPLSSLLNGVSIPLPGPAVRTNPIAAARHFQKALEEKLDYPLRRVLEELQPRFAHWVRISMNALHESLRLQTDPLRYRSPMPAGADADDNLMADIRFLQSS